MRIRIRNTAGMNNSNTLTNRKHQGSKVESVGGGDTEYLEEGGKSQKGLITKYVELSLG